MNYLRNFMDNDLKVQFLNIDEQDAEQDESEKSKEPDESFFTSYYALVYINAAKSLVVIDDEVYYYEEPVLTVAKPEARFRWQCVKGPYCYLGIRIHPNVFQNREDVQKALQFFYNLKGSRLVFELNKPEFKSISPFVENIQTALFAKCGRFSIEARVKALISELSLIYETQYKEYVASTDSIPAQILDYVDRHYLEKISLGHICEKFFISDKTANSIFRLYTGDTFGKYVTRLRMNDARKLLKSGFHKAKDVAALSGYSNYPAFFQNYKKYYGISPSQTLEKDSRYWPLKP